MKKLGFGCMRLPVLNHDRTQIDLGTFQNMADLFMARGFTHFDTAYVYHGGKSEEAVRDVAVHRYPRDAFTITDKMPMFNVSHKEDLDRIFADQLKRLDVTYIDYYWLHALNAAQYEKSGQLGAFDFILQKQKEGKIRHLGFSYHDSPELLEQILTKHPEVECVQLQLNYLDWDSPSIASRRCYEVAEKHHKDVFVMEPLKGGALVQLPEKAQKLHHAIRPELSIASWGIRFAASCPNVINVLSGMSTLRQVEDNTAYMENFEPLNQEERDAITKAIAILRSDPTIACTGCHYCVAGCPKKIRIPDDFALYNEHQRSNGLSTAPYYYRTTNVGFGKASDCIRCGACERVCPQHLKIRDLLVQVAKTFE